MFTSIDTITFGCQLASTYLALIFGDPKIATRFRLYGRCQGVSVGSGKFTFFRAFHKKFPRGPEDGFCGFECFRTSKISGYFRELNKNVWKCTNLRAASRPSSATLACGSNLVHIDHDRVLIDPIMVRGGTIVIIFV